MTEKLADGATPTNGFTLYPTIVTFDDYLSVIKLLIHSEILSQEKPFGVLIGCSSHSPIPADVFEAVVASVTNEILVPNKIEVLWYGGDPTFRAKTRGGNIADLLFRLSEQGILRAVGAVQREDWLEQTPNFVKQRIGYSQNLSQVDGRKTFGGYESKSPEGWNSFINNLKEISVCKGLFVDHVTPVGATAGYMCALPSVCRELIVIVIVQAGTITLKEIEYISILMKRYKNEISVKIFAITWNSIGDNLNGAENSGKCKLHEIVAIIEDLTKKFPENVQFINVPRQLTEQNQSKIPQISSGKNSRGRGTGRIQSRGSTQQPRGQAVSPGLSRGNSRGQSRGNSRGQFVARNEFN